MPAFLPKVYPAPEAVLEYTRYREGATIDRMDVKLADAICVTLDGSEIVEAADDGLESVDYLERSQLVVNEGVRDDLEPLLEMDYLGVLTTQVRDPETGNATILQWNATGPFLICWQVELQPGIQTVEYRIQKSSGIELSYRWHFHLID
jgi:hypothetical protein